MKPGRFVEEVYTEDEELEPRYGCTPRGCLLAGILAILLVLAGLLAVSPIR